MDCGTPTGRGSAILQYTPYTAVQLNSSYTRVSLILFILQPATGERLEAPACSSRAPARAVRHAFICLLSLACYHNLGSSDPHHLNGP